MRYALVNPNWEFTGSIYFGCREPHLPIEFGYSKAILEDNGHEVLLVDGHMFDLPLGEIGSRVAEFSPDVTVITTAPSYLFWRCPPPELRVPRELVRELGETGGFRVAVGPHGSTTPAVTLKKLGVDLVIRGEFEEVLPGIGPAVKGGIQILGPPHQADAAKLPALLWPAEFIKRHAHHHHRFDAPAAGPGAEMETSRGCPYSCFFCAKENFRNSYRKRPPGVVEAELDGLLERGVEYVYFVDEIFMPDRSLLEMFLRRKFKFGVQMRMDLWSADMLELLGSAGCVSIEAGVESVSERGRELLNKNCRIDFEEMTDRLIFAKKHVPFVQANLIASEYDDPGEVENWRKRLLDNGVWANRPVPLFPYPGTPLYEKMWGPPDDCAWERAHEHYLSIFSEFSDIQEQRPLSLSELEKTCACRPASLF